MRLWRLLCALLQAEDRRAIRQVQDHKRFLSRLDCNRERRDWYLDGWRA